MPLPDYDRLDGLALAARIREGAATASEAAEAALARLPRDERLGAFVHVEPPETVRAHAVASGGNTSGESASGEGSPKGASGARGSFAGVPYALKDLIHPTAGMPMRGGSEALRDFVPDVDASLVRRVREAGFVVLGKTAVPEMGLMGVTEPEAFGPTRNPWDLSRSPGGSSGGAAAAVAARIVPLADASDGGGSIRIPAAYCGLFGLKPSRGRVSDGPTTGEPWHGAAASLGVTRSVRDAAALLDALAGPEPGDPIALPAPEAPFLAEVGRDPGRLRIGLSTRSPLGLGVDPACVRAAEDAAELLASLGHDVDIAEPDIDGRLIARNYLTMYFGQVAATLRLLDRLGGPGTSRKTELATRLLGQIGESLSAGHYVELLESWNDVARAMGRFHETYDLFLTPTTAALPPRIGEMAPSKTERALMEAAVRTRTAPLLLKTGFVDRLVDENLSKTPFTQIANLAGLPSMSLPLAWTAPLAGAPLGLPVGVMFTGRPRAEGTMLRLAAQLEAARPWADRLPPLVPTEEDVQRAA